MTKADPFVARIAAEARKPIEALLRMETALRRECHFDASEPLGNIIARLEAWERRHAK